MQKLELCAKLDYVYKENMIEILLVDDENFEDLNPTTKKEEKKKKTRTNTNKKGNFVPHMIHFQKFHLITLMFNRRFVRRLSNNEY